MQCFSNVMYVYQHRVYHNYLTIILLRDLDEPSVCFFWFAWSLLLMHWFGYSDNTT